MLAIRLTKTGKKNAPHYRIVVQEKRSKLNGKSIDIIGHYHPASTGKELVIDTERAAHWIKAGAQPSDTVTNLFVKQGILSKEHTVHSFFTPTKPEPKEEKAEVSGTNTDSTDVVEAENPDSTQEVSPELPSDTAAVTES
jgi:small subunit ribosomal protein S16